MYLGMQLQKDMADYIVKVICKSYVFDLKKFFNILLEGVLGTLLASVVLVPSLFFTISNPRISNSFTLSSSLKYSSLINYIDIDDVMEGVIASDEAEYIEIEVETDENIEEKNESDSES